MARTRRNHSSSVFFAVVCLSLGLHSGAFALYDHLKPEPLPRLILAFVGDGGGVVESSPLGLSCSDNCSARFEPGTRLKLVATVTEDSTFEGWAGTCTPRSDWILECELVIEGNTRVQVGFGVVPERIDVALHGFEAMPLPERALAPEPDPEIEAELLLDPPMPLFPEPPPPELAQIELPKPPPPAPEQAEAPAPAPRLEEMPNMRSVEVPDDNEVDEAPEDATHLSDKNRDVAEETHATDTNLETAQQGDTVVSEESDIVSDDIGAKEDEIAQLDDAEPTTLDDGDDEDVSDSGRDDRVVGMIVGKRGERGERGERGDGRPAPTPGALSMRGIKGRGSIVTLDDVGDGGKRGKRGERGLPGINKELSFEDYQRIVGEDKVEEELALGRTKKKSKRRGRFERKMGAVKAALENFTPEVKPGNQTALKTRAAPFAVYIARMHRKIHELWGFGFLEDLDGKPAGHPLNNWDLWTKLEIVINPDGTIHKTTIVKNSGILEFDVAAIDALLTGEPYGQTPKEIRSPDGRIYIHWGFYRNHRQCGTFNANPFILAEAPDDADTVDDGDLVRKLPLRKRMQKLDADAERDRSKARSAAADALASPKDKEALHAANKWVTGFTYGQLSKMVEVSAGPFRSGDAIVANSAAEIHSIYRTVTGETKPPIRDWRLLTAAGYRKKFGALPAGIDATPNQLFMVVIARKERFTLELTRQSDGTFKVTGLHR